MKIVIDIPENEYRYIKEIYEKNDKVEGTYSYIYHGTPLPKGKWERVVDKANHWVWECDKCSWQQRFATNYCPDCGADMRGDEE